VFYATSNACSLLIARCLFAHDQESVVNYQRLGRPVVLLTAAMIAAGNFLVWFDQG